jgi:hypothetical protein|tara:strand:+ start:995 stop:1237 length:243 start_codon:yes stop_codon:yes gene_type:complete
MNYKTKGNVMTKDLFKLTDDQQKVLKKFNWDVTPQGKVLDLYHEDFQEGIWEQILQVMGEHSDKLTLFVIGVNSDKRRSE